MGRRFGSWTRSYASWASRTSRSQPLCELPGLRSSFRTGGARLQSPSAMPGLRRDRPSFRCPGAGPHRGSQSRHQQRPNRPGKVQGQTRFLRGMQCRLEPFTNEKRTLAILCAFQSSSSGSNSSTGASPFRSASSADDTSSRSPSSELPIRSGLGSVSRP